MSQSYFAEDSLPSLHLPDADLQAEALNQTLQSEAPMIYEALSACGKSLYYPSQGLLLQAEEAAASRYNATVGIALDDTGKPMHYSHISRMLNLDASQCVPYASSYGLLALRQLWQQQLLEKNINLKNELYSLPVVTGGITQGLWIAFQMFLGRGEELLLPHLFWPNYRLIAQANCGARLKHYNMFDGDGLDLQALQKQINAPGNKKVLLFNFPHNPTGYSPSTNEIGKLQEIFFQAAQNGKQLVIICDDAYWGLCYEEKTERQSLFAFIAGLHGNILAIKLDGATKEDFAWGLRVGFISFAYSNQAVCKVLEQKAGAAVRLSTSNSSRLSQELLLATYQTKETQTERQNLQNILAQRYRAVRQCLTTAPKEWRKYLQALPFNSGYFMTFEIQTKIQQQPFSADALRKYILAKYDIGVIALQNKYLRLAFSAIPEQDIARILATVHQACQEFSKQ